MRQLRQRNVDDQGVGRLQCGGDHQAGGDQQPIGADRRVGRRRARALLMHRRSTHQPAEAPLARRMRNDGRNPQPLIRTPAKCDRSAREPTGDSSSVYHQ